MWKLTVQCHLHQNLNSNGHIRIEHEGRVVSIGEEFIGVEMENKSACAQCHAKSVCAASEESIRVIEVPLTIGTMTRHYEIGEKVLVIMSSSLGAKAVVLAYAVPLVVLLLTMLCADAFGLTELYVGLCGIASLVLYYTVLWFFRSRLKRVFMFSIEKMN